MNATKQIIWCDAAPNTVTKVVNGYGKQVKYNNGGYRAGIKCDAAEEVFVNRQCPDQFAAECWSVLKAVEFAVEHCIAECVIRNDRIGGFDATKKRGYIGAKYLWVAQKLASENNIQLEFDRCTGAENLADPVSRRQS